VADPTVAALATSLRPTMVRAGLASLGTATGWNNTTGTPTWSFGAFDWFLGLAHNLSAEAYLSLPAGTWGDGNQLPSGMPLNTSLVVNSNGATGSFPTPLAYATLVGSLARHVASAGETVGYWNIGNEVPLTNASMLAAYIGLFNAASQAIHAILPAARVGSDVMTFPPDLATFAAQARDVGFLAFHYYPAQTVCVANGTICPPGSQGEDLTDAQIWNASSGYSRLHSIALGWGQREWHNLTGSWIPVLDAESNLNTAGGNPVTGPGGTDPRQQLPFGAAWTVSMLIDATASNVSRLNYYAFQSPATVPATTTGPYGGWGFGLVSLGPQGNATRYAPWWGLDMWGQNIPAGVAPLPLTVSDSNASRAIGVRNGSGDAVVLTNRFDTPVQFDVTDSGIGSVPIQVTVLDRTSFVTAFNASAQRVSLLRSGVNSFSVTPGSSARFVINGYGVAVVLFGSVPSHHVGNPPPLLSTSTFFEVTVLGAVLLLAATLIVYRPRRRRSASSPDADNAAADPGAEPADDEL